MEFYKEIALLCVLRQVSYSLFSEAICTKLFGLTSNEFDDFYINKFRFAYPAAEGIVRKEIFNGNIHFVYCTADGCNVELTDEYIGNHHPKHERDQFRLAIMELGSY